MHSERYGGLVSHDFAAVNVERFLLFDGFSVGILRLSVGDIPFTALPDPGAPPSADNRPLVSSTEVSSDYALYLSGGRRASDRLDLGASVKVVYRSVASFSAYGAGLDLGARFRLTPGVAIAAVLRDATTSPISWSTGTSDRVRPSLLLAAGITRTVGRGRANLALGAAGGGDASSEAVPMLAGAEYELGKARPESGSPGGAPGLRYRHQGARHAAPGSRLPAARSRGDLRLLRDHGLLSAQTNDPPPPSGAARCGYVALVGRPNAGKSTLFNAFLGQRLSIVTSKAQTTRCSIRGILSRPESQMIFLDTPGLLEPTSRLHETMGRQIDRSARDADVILLVIDASRPRNRVDLVRSFLERSRTPVVAALNKIDTIAEGSRDRIGAAVARDLGLDRLRAVSAATGENVHPLLAELEAALPLGARLYPDEVIADQPERFFAGELVREAAFEQLSEELPYSIAVDVDDFRDPGTEGSSQDDAQRQKKTYVSAVLYVDRDSQKGIVIGRGGSMLKRIGSRARAGIEDLLDREVYLDLRVKVRRDWRNRDRDLKEFGYA